MEAIKKCFILEGLCCANCAANIEREIKNLDGVNCASIDFISKKLTMEIPSHGQEEYIRTQVISIAQSHEPDISVIEFKQDSQPAVSKPKQKTPLSLKKKLYYAALLAGALLFLAAVLFQAGESTEFIMFLISYLLIGGEVVFSAIRGISKGHWFDENFLMSIATIGAFATRQYPEAVAVMLFYQVGEFFQNLAVNRSRKSIAALMDIRPDYANLKVNNELLRVAPEAVSVGDLIVVKPGEKIPLDGYVTEGRSALDTSALTGESIPRDVEPGNEVLSGSINKNGVLTISVSKGFGDSTVSKILDLVQNASSHKAPTENFITKFARVYTPAVVFAAIALAVVPPLLVPGAIFSDWLNRALVFLVVSCPCALVLSIPLSFFGGIGGASRHGILIKGSNFLEALNNVDTVVFDKTGTLTEGVPTVSQITCFNNWNEQELTYYAAHAESFSSHPVGQSILKAYGKEVDVTTVSDYEEIAGLGVKAKVGGKVVLAGNLKLMARESIQYETAETSGSTVYIAIDNAFAGFIIVSDSIKQDSRKTIKELKALGVHHIAMLTGDNKATGDLIADELGLDSVYSELLPEQKVQKLEELKTMKKTGGTLVYAGDGINDAPVIAGADIGIAMGALGSDAAIEAADIVLMTDEPSKIVTAIHIARKTKSVVRQNIALALGVKALILILSVFGLATMWEAVFGDVGVALLAVLNSLRTMRLKS